MESKTCSLLGVCVDGWWSSGFSGMSVIGHVPFDLLLTVRTDCFGIEILSAGVRVSYTLVWSFKCGRKWSDYAQVSPSCRSFPLQTDNC